MESDTDTFTYSDIDPNTDFHAGFDTDSFVYVRIEVHVDANKEIRIDTQVVTDFSSPIRTVFRRLRGTKQGESGSARGFERRHGCWPHGW
jgi:hypothetical protein